MKFKKHSQKQHLKGFHGKMEVNGFGQVQCAKHHRLIYHGQCYVCVDDIRQDREETYADLYNPSRS